MANNKKTLRFILISIPLTITLALVFAICVMIYKASEPKPGPQQGTAFSKSIVIPSFKLVDGDSKPFTNANLKGHWSLLFFGFTRCPKICPTTLSDLNKAYQLLRKQDFKRLPQVVFISIDPKHDSSKVIKSYVSSFNQNFIGATGNPRTLKQFSANFGIAYTSEKNPGKKNDEILHSRSIIIVNLKGEWAGVLTPPFTAKTIANDFIAIQNRG